MRARRACAVRARAVVAGIRAVLTLTHRVVATRAAALGAIAHRAGVRTVRTATRGAFVVVHTLLSAMLPVNVAIVQVVHMIGVEHRFMPTSRAVGVTVLLSLSVLDRGHGSSLPGQPSHAHMRSYECQDPCGIPATMPAQDRARCDQARSRSIVGGAQAEEP